jgi:hypothetical protein
MANKRTLKHAIRMICGELFAECFAVTHYGQTKHPENGEAVLYSIIKLQDKYISRVSHPEPGLSAATYYRDLRDKFNAEVDDIIGQIQHL